MAVKRYFAVRVNDKTYKMSLNEGMGLVQRMDTDPYNLSDHEIQCAQGFENYLLELKRKNGSRRWGVVHPPNQNK